ncbi:MAG: M56 family metallopeptidase, partial [Oscillospiraceae bacterium]|nr:M56 family metallopeptidase [Oscillospiraceae bacterium]
METLLALTLSGSALALFLMALRYLIIKKMPSTVYYYAWLLVLLRFLLPLPGLFPVFSAQEAPAVIPVSDSYVADNENHSEFQLTEPFKNPSLDESQNTSAIIETENNSEKSNVSAAVQLKKALIDWRSPVFWLVIWAGGAMATMGMTVFSYSRFICHLRQKLQAPDPCVKSLYESLPGSKPSLYICRAFKTPIMCGVIRPRIILPARQYDEELLTNILRHELMHYRRKDTLYKWFAVAVLSLHWFNPVSWIVRRELGRACELSCDEMLLRSMSRAEKQSYGNTLLNMASGFSLPAGVVATSFSTEKKNLKERLEQIMNYKKSKTRIITSLLALMLLAGSGIAAGPQAKADQPAEILSDDAVIVTNVDELLAAIAPNTVIELAAGEYDLSSASDYGADTHSSWYSWNGVYSNDEVAAELVIQNVDGLTLRGAGLEETTIAAVPRYASVIKFTGCQNLTIANLTAGHTTEPGFCA